MIGRAGVDVVAYFKACHDAFGQAAVIFKSIGKEAEDYSDLLKLARAGQAIALDMENMADCWREEVKNGGVRNT